MEEYFRFSGRINRATYWKYTLILAAVNILLLLLFSWYMSAQPLTKYDWYTYEHKVNPAGVIGVILFIIAFLVASFASLSVGVRRWHDHGRGGVWVLISLVPIVGPLYSLYMLGVMHGDPGANMYGPGAYPDAPNTTSRSTELQFDNEFMPTLASCLMATGVAIAFGPAFVSRQYWYDVGFGTFFVILMLTVSLAAGVVGWPLLMGKYGPDRLPFLCDCACGVLIFLMAATIRSLGIRNAIFTILGLTLVLLFIASMLARRVQIDHWKTEGAAAHPLNDPVIWSFVAFVVGPLWVTFWLRQPVFRDLYQLFDYNDLWIAFTFCVSAVSVSYMGLRARSTSQADIAWQ